MWSTKRDRNKAEGIPAHHALLKPEALRLESGSPAARCYPRPTCNLEPGIRTMEVLFNEGWVGVSINIKQERLSPDVKSTLEREGCLIS